MSSPTVSVIIPTFNRRELVQQAIDSVLAQTFRDFELIVVDDGSTDDTDQALKKYGSQIRYAFQANAGESVARQHGVELSSGQYLAFLDSDDRWLPEKLEHQVDALQTHPDAGFAYCWAYLIDNEGKRIALPPLGYGQNLTRATLQQLLENNFIVAASSSLIMRRDAYGSVNGFNQAIQFAEDWELCLRLAAKYKFIYQTWPLVEYRLHARGFLQRLENLDRMLQDHLRIIDGAIATLGASAHELLVAMPLAKANRYAQAAFAHFAYGEAEKGRERLTQACILAPETWANRDVFLQKAAEFAASLAITGDDARALAFAASIAAHLPDPLAQAGVTKSLVFSYTHKVLADYHKQRGDCSAARKNALQAVCHDPRWLAHRGVLSLLVKSFCGRNIKQSHDWSASASLIPQVIDLTSDHQGADGTKQHDEIVTEYSICESF